MARPTTKEELMVAAENQYKKMWTLIDSLTEDERSATFVFEDRDKNIKDILIHLYEWHGLLLRWLSSNQAGEEASFLPKPYNWKSYGLMNIDFWEKHQQTTYEEAVIMLNKSHKKVIELIEGFSDEELFTKKYFPWTGSTSVGSYCVSATSSHYDWAIKKIKKHIKTYKATNK